MTIFSPHYLCSLFRFHKLLNIRRVFLTPSCLVGVNEQQCTNPKWSLFLLLLPWINFNSWLTTSIVKSHNQRLVTYYKTCITSRRHCTLRMLKKGEFPNDDPCGKWELTSGIPKWMMHFVGHTSGAQHEYYATRKRFQIMTSILADPQDPNL